MNIRFAKEKDIDQIVVLCKVHADFEKAPFDSQNKATLLSNYFFEENGTIKCLVVELNNEIMGYATFMKQFSTWDANFYMYLDCLFLKKEIRGKGVGIQMMEKIKIHAKSENCSIIQWQTPNFNKDAIAFYHRLGAVSKTKERFFWNI